MGAEKPTPLKDLALSVFLLCILQHIDLTSCLFPWLQDGVCISREHLNILGRKEGTRTYSFLITEVLFIQEEKISPAPPSPAAISACLLD